MAEVIKSDGGAVHFDVRGPEAGPLVVLIEGLSAHMLGWRDGFSDLFIAAGFRVVRLDNRDVGLSAHYPHPPYGMADMADDVHQLITHLGGGPVHLVGQSMGGIVAQELVLRHPNDIASLALIYTTADVRHLSIDADRQAPPEARTRQEAIELHISKERACASRDYSFDEDWRRHLGGVMFDRHYDPAGVARQLDAVMSWSIELGELSSITVPTLLIHGTADQLIGHEASMEIHGAVPGSELWLVDGMGHDLPAELWPQLVARILSNCARADGPGPRRALQSVPC